ncbi:MAG: hydantoinase/oxoprolinase family protein [Gammaproteobacteria bacterium]|nr:hydantoinase/oxoprolinase family protein [Gammaproteobacteria bacterium]
MKLTTQLLGVDTGGTFTDFVLFDGEQLKIHKVLSTPHAPEEAIIQGVTELGLLDEPLNIVHGSTVATNAALEGKGVRTAFITNHGLGDMLTIGRQTREQLYAWHPSPVTPPVPRELCLETGGRLGADGSVVEDLSDDELALLKKEIERLKPEAVAINLLFSFIDDRFEKAIEAIIPDGIFISRSSKILPEYREYERGITTWLNAWVGPLVQAYLQRLNDSLPNANITVMQSTGGTIDVSLAGNEAVNMLLSGPAGGLAGARYTAAASGQQKLLSFDMGGTSTDVAMLNSRPDEELTLTNNGKIGRYPVAVPMVDMHTIGAGGGSIAYLDAGGLLQLGPESAGAHPGPACYGKGGTAPTVTDANLVQGRLQADAFLGGKMKLNTDAARTAVKTIATPLGLSIEAAAQGIIEIANEQMAQALRVISVQQGHDPRDFTLVSFGGAGGLHVCALAEKLGMTRALVPIHGGVLSALGMLTAPRARQLSRTLNKPLLALDDAQITEQFERLKQQGITALQQEGLNQTEITTRLSLDLCYQGQSSTLNIPWKISNHSIDDAISNFHQTHESRYGHRLNCNIELVNVRTGLHGPMPSIALSSLTTEQTPDNSTSIYPRDLFSNVSIIARDSLTRGKAFHGPALITETVSTTFINQGWSCTRDGTGNLLLINSTSPH